MRIVSGKYGGRVLEAPKGRDIRPTSDKVRGAIFNALKSRGVVEDARVMDCFCGSGALGLEALSQGVQSCLFIDKDRKSLDLARRNGAALGVSDEAQFLLKDVTKIPARLPDSQPRTLVFLDPPYGQGLVIEALKALDHQGWLEYGAMCVVEAEKSLELCAPDGFETVHEKTYGDTNVFFLRYEITPV